MEENQNIAFLVEDNDGTLIASYRQEGTARRFCKDRGYSYTEFHADVVSKYWRNRCLLAERVNEASPCDPDITSQQIEAHKAYNDFLTNNKEPK